MIKFTFVVCYLPEQKSILKQTIKPLKMSEIDINI